MTFGSAKAVTITVYYTTGTVLVQGNRCTSWVKEEFSALMDTIRAMYILANHHTQPYYTTGTVLVQGNRCTSWVKEEFSALMDTIRAMYILANHHTQPDLHKEVDEGLRLLPLPSPDSTSTQTTSAGDSGTRPSFVTALLAKAVLSPTPSLTGGCPPATPTSAVTTRPSPRPSHPSPTQPNGGQQETTNRRSDLETTKAKYSHTTPPFQQQDFATQSTSKKKKKKKKKLMQSAQNPTNNKPLQSRKEN